MRVPVIALGWVLTLAVSFGLGWYLAQSADPRWDAVRALEAEPGRVSDARPERVRGEVSPLALGDAVRAALRQPDRLDRFSGLVRALEALGPENLAEVLEAYEEEEAGIGDCEMRPFIYTWARFDAPGAFAHTRGWTTRVRQRMGTAAAVYAWALRDPVAARSAVESIENDPNSQERMQRALVQGWVHSGVPGLMEYLSSFPEGQNRGRLTSLALVVIRWSQGAEAMLRLVSALPDDAENDFKRTAFRKAAQLMARLNPELAAEWVQAHSGSDWAEDGVRVVAEQWSPVDPDAAFDWLRAEPPGQARDQAVRAGFSRWLKEDREAAGAWLGSASLTEFHDPALDVFARRTVSESPEEAIDWARRIADAERRLACLTAVAKRWFSADPKAAGAWLSESELSEEARRAVRKSPPRARRRPLWEDGHEPTKIEIQGLETVDPF